MRAIVGRMGKQEHALLRVPSRPNEQGKDPNSGETTMEMDNLWTINLIGANPSKGWDYGVGVEATHSMDSWN